MDKANAAPREIYWTDAMKGRESHRSFSIRPFGSKAREVTLYVVAKSKGRVTSDPCGQVCAGI